MKHILIPTDFTVQSLNTVHAAIAHYEGERLKITLLHLLMPNDIPALLFASMRNKHYDLVNDDFNEACQILQTRHTSRLAGMQVKFGFGSTSSYLKNYLEGERVDTIVISPDLRLQMPSPKSVDMLPLLKRTGYPVYELNSINIKRHHTDMNIINMLPPNEIKVPKAENYAIEK